jgi:hypothetical protein
MSANIPYSTPTEWLCHFQENYFTSSWCALLLAGDSTSGFITMGLSLIEQVPVALAHSSSFQNTQFQPA